jgi:VanZ family protein
MTLEPTTTSDRARRGPALLVMGAGVAALAAGMALLPGGLPGSTATGSQAPDVGSRFLSVIALCLVLLLWGAAPAWASGQLLKRPWLALGLPVWLVVLGLASWWLLQVVVSFLAGPEAVLEQADAAWNIVICCVLVLVLTLGSALVASAYTMPWRTAVRCAFPLVLVNAPWIALGSIAFLHSPEAGAGRLGRPEPWVDRVVLLLTVLAIGVSGAAAGHFLRRPTVRRGLSAVLTTGVCAVAGFFFLNLMPSPDAGDQGQPLSVALVFLGLDAGPPSAPSEHSVSWCLAYLAATLVLGWAQWSGLLLSRYEIATSGDRDLAAEGRPAALRPRKWIARPGRVYSLLALAYVVFVVYGSLVPLDWHGQPLDKALEHFLQTPYLQINIQRRADLVVNLLLFIPLMFFAMGAWTRENSRPGRGLKALCLVVLACLLAVAIEFTQIFFPPRTMSLNDIQNECISGAAGVGLWLLFGDPITRWVRDLWRKRDPRHLAIHICAGYVVVLALYGLYPFDFVISKDELADHLQSGHLNLVPLADLGRISLPVVAARVAMLVPVGYLVAMLRVGRRRPVRAALLLGGAYALVTEVLRIFVYSLGSSVTDMLLGTAGAALGGWLAVRFGPVATRPLPQGAAWRLLSFIGRLAAGLGGTAAIFWYQWQPRDFHWPREGVWACALGWIRVPFYYQYYNTEFQATIQMGRDTAAPLVLALVFTSLLGPLGRAGRWMAGAMAAGVGVAAEVGRIFFPPRVPDLTTTLFFAVLGAALGVLLHDPLVRIFVRPPAAEGGQDGDWSST